MDHDADTLRRIRLRAFDLSGRTLKASRTSAVRRLDRWRQRGFMIAQMAVTAGLAWWLAVVLLGHPQPFFAAVAAIITLGVSFGSRLRRAVEVAIGVAVGVGVGELWVAFFGQGVWQIIAVCAIAMSIATLVGAGQLMIIQAGVQSIIVISLGGGIGTGVFRFLDAIVGCILALAVATIAPSSPLRRPGVVAAQVLREMAAALEATAVALRSHDEAAADAVLEQARAGEKGLASFEQAAAEGVAVVRHSPFRRRDRGMVAALAELSEPLDHASRNLRVLARRAAVAAWRGHPVPDEYGELINRLAATCRFMADELEDQRLPTAARDQLAAIGRDSAHAPLDDSLSGVVVLAQIRSMTADLLELTGIDYATARELIPEMD